MSYLESKVINTLIIFIIVLMIICVLISFFNYQPYILIYGEVDNDIVNIYLTDDEISKLNNKLKYENKITDYEIVNVSHEYLVIEDKLKKEVQIKFNHDSNKYIVELYIGIGEETNFWSYLYKKYMKGVL